MSNLFSNQDIPGPDLIFSGELGGQMVSRVGRVARVYDGPVYYVMATDSPALWPRHFFVRSIDEIHYFEFLSKAWKQNQRVVYDFRLFRSLGIDFVDQMKLLDTNKRLELMASMRDAGLLPRLKKLNIKSMPKGMLWADLKSLYLKQLGEF